ncbi:uncharacterized protein LOC142977204 [Anticarsia gemmatalis]|uniref:uncharacterized protein LOC142977204 n=1 Tax=Anticarsia gemmatalis TaxID=129554 RepID=UPI003F772838
MECTQRLECTQELYDTHTQRVCPEQIGFLGICGAKHPVLRGPNKIGRDPQTCSIVLNLNSVSRQHAVINVLNSKEYMLMDLDSANKTKLLNKTLQPYIPHPIRNGDTVQFGDIFGIFRLLEEDDELPMTQAIDIPETPVPTRQVSKLTTTTTTMIPESPDVSDKDDSFQTPLQKKSENTRLSSGQFIKPFGKSIAIHPISSPKTNTSRDSSKRTISFADPNTSLNESLISLKVDKEDIHEMDTQAPYPITHPVNDSTDSIYTADTQMPMNHKDSPSIHSLDTQLPTTEHLPQVCKISDQQDMQFDLYAANKENDLSIFNAETQPFICEKDEPLINKNTVLEKVEESPKKDLNTSNDELLFDEIDDGCFDDLNSQPLLPQESPKRKEISKTEDFKDSDDIDFALTQKVEELPSKEPVKVESKPTASKRTARIKSDSSTDCEDLEFMPTQKIPELPVSSKENTKNKGKIDNDDDSTDCEDIDIIPTQKIPELKPKEDDDLTDCEDDFIELKKSEPSKEAKVIEFEDMPTQLIDVDPEKVDQPAFEDMDTQIVGVDESAVITSNDIDDQATQIVEEVKPDDTEVKKSFKEIVSPFKIPLQSPIRVKSKDIVKVTKPKSPLVLEDDNYYNATQDILDDLCTQREGSPIIVTGEKLKPKGSKSPILLDDDIVPSSVEDYKAKDMLANIDRDLSPTKPFKGQKAAKNTSALTSQEVRDVIGDAPVANLKKVPSDSSSDIESTPKKVRTFIFTDSDLPNSQEIHTNIHHTKSIATESSSESEPENSEEQYTPLVHKKKKTNKVVKIDLTKKFNVEKLPERIITRVRKPTVKMEENLLNNKKAATSMLKPKFLQEQEDQISEEIIKENVLRLKTYVKGKASKSDSPPAKDNEEKHNDTKNQIEDIPKEMEIKSKEIKNETKKTESKSTTKIEPKNKLNELKEKIKVKIEKPKSKKESKDTKPKSERSTRKSKEESSRRSRHKSPVATNEDSRISEKQDKSKSVDEPKSDAKSTRVTRSRRKDKDNTKSPERKDTTESKRKRYTKKKDEPKQSFSPEVEIRRSKRQAKAKSDSQSMDPPKSILKKSTLEQSTVYNVSSGGESPKNNLSLKRSLGDDTEVPSPKRTRAFVNNVNSSITNSSLRATPARTLKTQHVLLTAFPSVEVKTKLEKLGAIIVTDVMECSVVLTLQIKRTFKLLCAVGLGRPIVGPSWVQACADTRMIVDPWLYLVKDEAAEKRFQFNLERTLNGKRNFLEGYNVSSTPSVQPNATEMKLIVECSGGSWREGGRNWICVSCTKDQALWTGLRCRGAKVVSTEFILGGVLKQKIDINNTLFP